MSVIIANAPIQKSYMYSTEDERRVMELFIQGTSHADIQRITQLPLKQVSRIIRLARLQNKAEKLQEELTKQAIEKKIPLMRKINEVTLSSILDYVTALSRDKPRLLAMSPRDAKDLMNIVSSSAELINLTIGTQVKLPHKVDEEALAPMFQVIIENTNYEPPINVTPKIHGTPYENPQVELCSPEVTSQAQSETAIVE